MSDLTATSPTPPAPVWEDYVPGVDLLGRTVRLLDDTGRVYTQGQATHGTVLTSPMDALMAGVELVPDPDAPGLDSRARALAAYMRDRGLEHAAGCPEGHGPGVVAGFVPTWTLQVLAGPSPLEPASVEDVPPAEDLEP